MDRLTTFAALLLMSLASACGAPERTRLTQPPALTPALSCPSSPLTGRVGAGETRGVWSARLAEGARVRVATSSSPRAGQLSLSGPAERSSSVAHVAFWGEHIPDGPPEPPSLDVRVALEGTWSLRLTAEAQPVDYAVCVEVDAPMEEPRNEPMREEPSPQVERSTSHRPASVVAALRARRQDIEACRRAAGGTARAWAECTCRVACELSGAPGAGELVLRYPYAEVDGLELTLDSGGRVSSCRHSRLGAPEEQVNRVCRDVSPR